MAIAKLISRLLLTLRLLAYSGYAVRPNPGLKAVQKVATLPVQIALGAANLVKESVYSLQDASQNSRSIEKKKMISTQKDFPFIFEVDDVLNSAKASEERVGNVYLTAKQVLRAASPINTIDAFLGSMKGVVSTYYNIVDGFEEDSKFSDTMKVQKIDLYTKNSADQLDFKEIVYQFADTVEGVAEGVVSVAKAIPVVVEAMANFPQVLSEIQKDATRKIEELKDAVVDTKSAINAFLTWRPLEEARFYLEMTRENIEETVNGVKSNVEGVVDFATGTVNFATSMTKPKKVEVKEKETLSLLTSVLSTSSSKLNVDVVKGFLPDIAALTPPEARVALEIISNDFIYLKNRIEDGQRDLAEREADTKLRLTDAKAKALAEKEAAEAIAIAKTKYTANRRLIEAQVKYRSKALADKEAAEAEARAKAKVKALADKEAVEAEARAKAKALADKEAAEAEARAKESVKREVVEESMFLSFLSSIGDESENRKTSKGTVITTIIRDIASLVTKSSSKSVQDLLKKYASDVIIPDNASLELIIRASINEVWKSQGEDWDAVLQVFEQELSQEVKNSDKWMKGAIAAANELTISRLKEIIRSRGGPEAMPKGAPKKLDYVGAAVAVVRASTGNNFQEVTAFFLAESGTKKKGFG